MLSDELGGDGHLEDRRWLQHGFEDGEAVGGAHERIAGAFGVGHHAHDIAFAVEDAGDVAGGAVGVFDVAEGDAVFGFEFIEGAVVGKVLAFAVRDGKVESLAFGAAFEVNGRVGGFGAEGDVFADELEVLIAEQRAGQQAGFDQNLEAVADAEDEPAIGREFFDGLHDGGEARDGAAAKVVAVGEAAGEDNGVDIVEGGGIVPDEFGLTGGGFAWMAYHASWSQLLPGKTMTPTFMFGG